MVEYRYPGVYVEELSVGPHTIEGVSTSTAGFVGLSGRGPLLGPLTSFMQFEPAGTDNPGANLALALRGFFDNGGRQCFISQISPRDPLESGLGAFDGHDVSVVCCPDDTTTASAAVMARHCEARKDRVCILQATQAVVSVAAHRPPVQSSYAAYYHPWLEVPSLEGTSKVMVPPCGHIAGVYARNDIEHAVWKAPANEALVGVTGLSQEINETDSEMLSASGVDSIRKFAGQGIRVWGARTTSPDPEWKYINVRRLFLYIEQSLYQGLQWVVFEPNDAALWKAVGASIETFLAKIWRDGGLQGAKPEEAFFVKCDRETMTQTDIDNGRMICLIGVAPLKPAEFVILRIGVWMQCIAARERNGS
jgi:phage tail sheath protein FI